MLPKRETKIKFFFHFALLLLNFPHPKHITEAVPSLLGFAFDKLHYRLIGLGIGYLHAIT